MNATGNFNAGPWRNRGLLRVAMTALWVGLLIASAHAAERWPLGKLTLKTEKPKSSPEGYDISGFVVSCPGVEKPLQGFLAVAPHRGAARGLVMFFTGGDGTCWWTGKDPQVHKLAEELRTDGFTIVQVMWKGCWHHSSPGNDAGTAHLACRPATIIKHVHEKYYLPLGIKPSKPGQAGFCITGNSGGATQVSYAMSHYGLDCILDVVIPSGGPPHSVLAKSMLEPENGRQGYGYPEGIRTYIDMSFGYFEKDGPGQRQDAAFKSRWEQESVATGGNDYQHPKTRIHFIFGDRDKGMQTVAKDYFDRLRQEESPMVKWELALDTNHGVAQTAAGRAALKAAILGIAGPDAPEGKEAAPPSPLGKTPPAVAPDKPDANAGEKEPTVIRFKENPIIRPKMLPGDDGENICGPSLIRVPDWLEKPFGKYYLYFAHHKGTYIRLAYADRLGGPWKVHEPGTLKLEDLLAVGDYKDIKGSHVASPDVHVDNDRKEIRMYFHGLIGPVAKWGHNSGVAVSKDGIRFKPLPKKIGEPYFRVFRWDGHYYAVTRTGNLARSKDGLTDWEERPDTYALGKQALGKFAEATHDKEAGAIMRHTALKLDGTALSVYFTRTGDAPEAVLLSKVDLSVPWTKWQMIAPVKVLEPETEYEGGKLPATKSRPGSRLGRGPIRALQDPCIFREGGKSYLLYSVAGESGIAIADLNQ